MSGESTTYYRLDGGRNDYDPPSLIPDNYYLNGSNTRLVGLRLKTREGYTKLNSVSTGNYSFTGLFRTVVNGTSYLIAMDTSGNVYKMDYSAGSPDGTWDIITTAPLTTSSTVRWSLTHGTYLSGTARTQRIILTNNDAEPQVWTGTGNISSLSASTNRPTKSKIVDSYGFKVIHHNITDTDGASPFRTRWSNSDDATTYSLYDFKDWPNDGSSGIICSFVHRNYMFVATNRSIHRMTYTGNTTNNSALLPFTFEENICQVPGVAGPQSYCIAEGIVVILAPDKRLYLFDGACFSEVGREIRTLLDSITSSRLQYSWIKYNPVSKELYIGCDTGNTGKNDTIICGNCEGFNSSTPVIRWNNPWTIPANCIEMVDVGGVLSPYFGDSASSGYTYKLLTGTNDNGSAVSAYVLSKVFSFEGDHLKKELRAFDIALKGQTGTNNLTVDFYRDGASSSSLTLSISQTSSADPYSPDPITSTPLVSNWNNLQVRFQQNTLDKQFEIYSYGFIRNVNDINY